MKNRKITLFWLIIGLIGLHSVKAQEKPDIVKVKPVEIFDVLNNPGIGFTTFQRFNGDDLNEKLTVPFPPGSTDSRLDTEFLSQMI